MSDDFRAGRSGRDGSALRLAGSGAVLGMAVAALLLAGVAQPWWFGDADWYASALPALEGRAPLYPSYLLEPHLATRPVAFNLPPAAALLAPLAALGRGPWGVLMLAALASGLALCWPRLRQPWDLVLAGVVVIWIPVLSAAVWANLNSLVVLLIAVAVRWPRQAGWAIGAATAIKAAPVFLFAWLIGRGDWRGVAIGLAVAGGLTGVAMLLTGPEVLYQFVQVRLNEIPDPGPLAVSLSSLGLEPWVGYVVASMLAVVAVARRSLMLAVLACLVAVPELHAHYWVWALPPMLASRRPLLSLQPAAVARWRRAPWSRESPAVD